MSGSEDLSLLLLPADVLFYLSQYLNLKNFSSLASTCKRADQHLWSHRRDIPAPEHPISPYALEFKQHNFEFFKSLLIAANRGKLKEITKLSGVTVSDANMLESWSGVLRSMPSLQDISIQVTNSDLEQVIRDTLTVNPAIHETLVALRIQAPDVPPEMPELIRRLKNLRTFQFQTTHLQHNDVLVLATIAALPSTVEELVLNISIDRANGFLHLPRLARLWMKSNPELTPLIYSPHPYDFMAVEEEDPEVRLAWRANLANWKSLLTQLETKLPGKMAIKTVFYTSIENGSDWQDDPEEIDESLLHMFVTLEDPVPALQFALEYLGKEEFAHAIMAKYEWAPRKGYRSEQIESVFEYSLSHSLAAKFLIETIQPDLIKTGLLPIMIKAFQRSPEMLEYVLGPLLDVSLEMNHLRREDLGNLFFSSLHGQGSVLFVMDTWEWKALLTRENIPRLAIDVNARSADENRPLLHYAVRSHSVSSISILIDLGADILAADSNGQVALELALSLPDLAVIDYIIKLYKFRGLSLPDRTVLSEERRVHVATLLLQLFMDIEHSETEYDLETLLEMVYLDDLLAIVSNRAIHSGSVATQAMLEILKISEPKSIPHLNLGAVDTHLRRIVAGLRGSGRFPFSSIDEFRARIEEFLKFSEPEEILDPSEEKNAGWTWA